MQKRVIRITPNNLVSKIQKKHECEGTFDMKMDNVIKGTLPPLELETSREKRERREAQVLQYQAEHPEEIYKTRRDNLLRQVDAHGTTGLASMLGYRQPSFISQMTSENWNRVVTERSARKFETKLGLKPSALDVPIKPIENIPIATNRTSLVTAWTPPTQAISALTTPTNEVLTSCVSLIARTSALIAQVINAEKVDVSVAQFIKLLNIVILDAAEPEYRKRELHIKQLLEMLK